MLVQCTSRDFVHVLAIGDRWLLGRVLVPLLFSKDGLDLFIKVLTAVTHEKNLQGLFDRNASLEVLIVHQERNQVVELTGFEVAWIRDATLVHSLEFLLANVTVQVVIDLPDNELDLGACGLAAEELKSAGDVHSGDLVKVVLLALVLRGQEVEHAIELLLLDRLDLDGLEDLSGTLLQFLHFVTWSVGDGCVCLPY